MANGKFLQRVSLEDARATAAAAARLTPPERVPSEDSHGRVTAEPVYAQFPTPHFRASAMDGIAVRSADTIAAADYAIKLRETQVFTDIAPADAHPCYVVDTGNPLPAWADAVVRIEDADRCDGGFRIVAPVPAGRDVRRIGEDIEAGTRIIARGQAIRPFDVGAMLATGVREVLVRAAPSVAAFATGTEIVEPGGDRPAAGEIVEYNSRMLDGFAAEWGARFRYLGRIADDPEEMALRLRAAASAHDVICVIAGSSTGRKDFTVDVLKTIGKLHYHGVDMMPGKPTAFATVDGTPVLGVPGYPVSAFAAYREILEPVVAACLGRAPVAAETVLARVRRKIPSRLGVDELLRVALSRDRNGLIAALLPRGAGSVSTLTRADGILRIGPNSEGLEPESEVTVELLRPRSEIGDTVVVGGRPDDATAALEDSCRKHGSRVRFAHLGLADLDSVEALACGEAVVAVLFSSDGDAFAYLDSRLPLCEKIPFPGSGAAPNQVMVLTESFAESEHGRAIRNAIADSPVP